MARPSIHKLNEFEIDERRKYSGIHKFHSIRSCISIYSKRSGKKFQTKEKDGVLWVRRLS